MHTLPAHTHTHNPHTQAVGGVIPTLVTNSHSALYEALTQLSKADPSSPAFDLSVLEVIELLEHHHKVTSRRPEA